jgi:hypothetical protein
MFLKNTVALGFLLFTVVFAINSRIQDGTHPKISYGDQIENPVRDLRVRYRVRSGSVYEYEDGPRYFLLLEDEVVEQEVEYRMQNRRWSDRVLLEKLYFCALFGTSGLPKPSDAPKEVQKLESAEGWEILDRDSDYCTWEGVSCDDDDGKITQIRLGNFELGGTIPEALGYLETLVNLDLRGKLHNFSFDLIAGESTKSIYLLTLKRQLSLRLITEHNGKVNEFEITMLGRK